MNKFLRFLVMLLKKRKDIVEYVVNEQLDVFAVEPNIFLGLFMRPNRASSCAHIFTGLLSCTSNVPVASLMVSGIFF